MRTVGRRSAALLASGALVVSGALAGCQDSSNDTRRTAGAAKQSPVPSQPPATIAVSPANGAGTVRPDKPVAVTVSGGRLTSVTVTADGGQPVSGAIAAGGGAWTSTGKLQPGTRYQVSATAKNPDGVAATSASSFTTLTPQRTVSASVVPGNGWTVGVGMPVVVEFSRPVKDRAAAERGLSVTSSPRVEGSWRWFSSSQVQWRPRQYWPSGTSVTVATSLSGVELAPGVWGKNRRSTSFRVGSAMISTVDVRRHTMTVKRDGRTIRTIPVTTGKQGFATRNGVKVIMSRESSRRMDAETTGIARSDPEYYDVKVKYAMRLTHSGEFVHAAPWSVGSQGRANVSHGCTGMSTAHAQWLYSQSKVGDVVVYTGSKRPLEWGNGYTVWDMSYDRWTSA
jgi:lipoprotein-anchoring transpeptidase ErfK/SrfK